MKLCKYNTRKWFLCFWCFMQEAHHLFAVVTTRMGKASKPSPVVFASTVHQNGLSCWTIGAHTQGSDRLPATYVLHGLPRRPAWCAMCARIQERSLTSAVSAVLPSSEATHETDMSTAILVHDFTSACGPCNTKKKWEKSKSVAIKSRRCIVWRSVTHFQSLWIWPH